jgi:hypothetical protein
VNLDECLDFEATHHLVHTLLFDRRENKFWGHFHGCINKALSESSSDESESVVMLGFLLQQSGFLFFILQVFLAFLEDFQRRVRLEIIQFTLAHVDLLDVALVLTLPGNLV